MAIYRLKADAYLKYASYKWKACFVFAGFVTAAVLSSRPESSARYPKLAVILPHLYGPAVIGAIFSFGSIFACYYAPKIAMTLQIRFEADGVFRSGGGAPDLFIPWEEITGFTERKSGLILRTMDPTRNLPISSDFEGYAEIKMELASRGIVELRRDSADSLLRSPGLLVALSSIVLLLLGQTLGHAFATGNLYVAVAVGGIGYIGWRNQFRQKSRTLMVLLLLLTGAIFMLVPHSHGDAWELSYLALNGVLGLAAYGISAFREERH